LEDVLMPYESHVLFLPSLRMSERKILFSTQRPNHICETAQLTPVKTMAASVRIFVKGEWNVEPFKSESSAWAWGGWPPEHRFEKLVKREDLFAAQVARALAQECGLKLHLYDLTGLKGWIIGHVYHVKTTPTIIVGDQRIEGPPSKEQFLQLLQRIKSTQMR